MGQRSSARSRGMRRRANLHDGHAAVLLARRRPALVDVEVLGVRFLQAHVARSLQVAPINLTNSSSGSATNAPALGRTCLHVAGQAHSQPSLGPALIQADVMLVGQVSARVRQALGHGRLVDAQGTSMISAQRKARR